MHCSLGESVIARAEDRLSTGKLEKSLFGENLGARDPFAAEVESNFAENVLGNFDTEHIVKPPDQMASHIGLSSKRCVGCEGGDVPLLDEKQVDLLRQQVPGWKVVVEEGVQKIQHTWTVADQEKGRQLMGRLGAVAEEEGHHPDLHITRDNTVTAEFTTHAVGGLTLNDFIMASKVNQLDLKDLLPKSRQRFWA